MLFPLQLAAVLKATWTLHSVRYSLSLSLSVSLFLSLSVCLSVYLSSVCFSFNFVLLYRLVVLSSFYQGQVAQQAFMPKLLSLRNEI